MTSLPASVREWLRSPAVVYECRNCGTTLHDDRTVCLDCESTNTVRYIVE